MAIIAVIAAATPAMIPIIGPNVATPKILTIFITANMAGARVVKAAITAPSITTKFCTGSGNFPKNSPIVFIPEAIGGMILFARFISASPSGTRLCSSCLMLASNVWESVVDWSNIFSADPATSS